MQTLWDPSPKSYSQNAVSEYKSKQIKTSTVHSHCIFKSKMKILFRPMDHIVNSRWVSAKKAVNAFFPLISSSWWRRADSNCPWGQRGTRTYNQNQPSQKKTWMVIHGAALLNNFRHLTRQPESLVSMLIYELTHAIIRETYCARNDTQCNRSNAFKIHLTGQQSQNPTQPPIEFSFLRNSLLGIHTITL